MHDFLSPATLSLRFSFFFLTHTITFFFFLRPFHSSSSSKPFSYFVGDLSDLSLSPANSSLPFSYSATNHCCREEELIVKRLWGALRRFPWRATPPSTVEGASSASTVEVSTTVLYFRHCCRSREASSRVRIKWSGRCLRISWSVNYSDIVYGSSDL